MIEGGGEKVDRLLTQENPQDPNLNLDVLKLEQMKLSPTARDAYIVLLGTDRFPESPSDLPEKVRLPAVFATDLEGMIATSLEHGNEVSLMRYLNTAKGKFHDRTFTGHPLGSGQRANTDKGIRDFRWVRGLTREEAFINFHTHIHPDGSPFFSTQDVASLLALKDPAPLMLVGSKTGLYGLLQTEKFKESQKVYSHGKFKNELERQGYHSKNNPNSNARILESFGLSVFHGPRSDNSWTNGVVLNKIIPR